MKRVLGFNTAKAILQRSKVAETFEVSPVLQHRLREMFGTVEPEQAVKQIINDVRQRGDAALFDYAQKIDGIKLSSLIVTKEQITAAYGKVETKLVDALKVAAERVRNFHQMQRNNIYREFTGGGLGQVVRPLQRVGVYAPGGTAWYPSTVIMTAVPAKVAGVKEVYLASPPAGDGELPAPTLVAADIAGVDRIFAMGGAQAIAAMAIGTNTVPAVDKICGPGNIFVVLAKKLVFGTVGIDGLQGPSEVFIIADHTANPRFCAADLIAQAEHDPLSSSILVTTSGQLADEVLLELGKMLSMITRQKIATEALKGSVIAVVDTVNEAVELANLFAPEHLSLIVEKPEIYLPLVTNAGCVFLGPMSPVVLGDYVIGPSHVLPTGGTARFSSALNVIDFLKFINWARIGTVTFKELGPVAITIARNEGLTAHAAAVESRLEEMQ